VMRAIASRCTGPFGLFATAQIGWMVMGKSMSATEIFERFVDSHGEPGCCGGCRVVRTRWALLLRLHEVVATMGELV